MSIEIVAGPVPAEGTADVLAVPVFADRTWGPGADRVVEQLDDWAIAEMDAAEFDGSAGSTVTVPGAGKVPYRTVVFVGFGEETTAESLRRAAGTLGHATTASETVATTLHQVDVDDAAEHVVFGYLLGQYRFDKYRTEPKPVKTERLVLAGADDDDLAAASVGEMVAAGVARARDLVNEPAGGKPPVEMARIASEIGEAVGVTVRVLDEVEITEERLGGLLGVAKGAHNPPRLVEFRYEPDDPKAFVAFVGKGIVFDSGGLSIKPAKSMETMKTDMSGAAAVFGAVQTIAALGLPVRVLGITPLTENMPGGGAQRPGDVLTVRNGKTIEVLNTDAEGRLVLADGLSLAVEAEPDLIIDVATLTGACAVALGDKIGGLFTNDDRARRVVEQAGEASGERIWAMPLPGDYFSYIESEVADMMNRSSSTYGGAITAASLLQQFVDDRPWAHLDIAGPARSSKVEHYISKGGTGFGVRTLVGVARLLAEDGWPEAD